MPDTFDPTSGPARATLTAAAVAALPPATVIKDARRQRPLYFDGRFLTARDLTREQDYFLTRQADIGAALGAGVVTGLTVSDEKGLLRIAPGVGLTPAGESVVLREPLTIRPEDVTEVQKLDAAFGLSQIPSEPARNRTGLFVVALRPVEYTANPIASYPTSVSGPRTLEDGDVIEAVIVTLVPYPDEGVRTDAHRRRSRVALDIFVRAGGGALPVSALPLAMVSLNRGVLEWVDPFLVRREIGAVQGDVLGLGVAPRALREAHAHQYDTQLAEILKERGTGQRFAASDYFLALPPAGRMPAPTIDPKGFTQLYFPPSIRTDLSLVPDDELPALVEDSLLLPPIDLTLGADELDSTAVLVLVPVPRADWRHLRSALTTVTRPLVPAAPNLLASRRPIELVLNIRLPRLPVPALPVANLVDQAWAKALAAAPSLWYVRRRNLALEAETGTVIRLADDLVAGEKALLGRLKTLGLEARFKALKAAADLGAYHAMIRLLSAPAFGTSSLLTQGAVGELEDPKVLDAGAASAVAKRFASPTLGAGIERLQAAEPKLKGALVVEILAASRVVPELDRLGMLVPQDKLAGVADAVEKATHFGPKPVAKVVADTLKELET